MTPEQLKEKFDEYGLSAWFAEARRHLRNAITLKIDAAAAGVAGGSRLGGQPDLPPDLPWPRHDGRPLAFIAQIDCAQVRPFDLDGRLPERGWLYLFYDAQEHPWGYDPKDAGSTRVHFHQGDGGALAAHPFPDDLPEDCRFAPAALSFATAADVPDPDSHRLECELDDYEAWMDLREDAAFLRGGSKLLGHSSNIQNGQELQCELVTNGLYCGDSSGYRDPRRAQLEANAPQWSLLMQIDSEEDCGMYWGDSGRLYVWIREQDLRERRFDRVWLIQQCY